MWSSPFRNVLTVIWDSTDGVVGMEKCFLGQMENVLVVRLVEDRRAISSRRDKSRETQLGEMLRHRSRLRTDVVSELVDRVLTMEEGPDHSQPGGIREQLEGFDGQYHLVTAWISYLRSHADSVPLGSIACQLVRLRAFSS
jgi:hypothetical protein